MASRNSKPDNPHSKFLNVMDSRVAMSPGMNLNDAALLEFLTWLDSLANINQQLEIERNGKEQMSFTYPGMARAIKCLTAKQVEGSIAKLKKKEVLVQTPDTDNQNKNWYQVIYHKIRDVFGEDVYARYWERVDARLQAQGSANKEPHESEENEGSANKELPPEGSEITELTNGQGSVNAEARFRKRGTNAPYLRRQGSVNAEAPIYIESILLTRLIPLKDSSVPNGTGATAPNPETETVQDNVAYVGSGEVVEEIETNEEVAIDEPKTVFAAIARTAYHGLVVDEESKKLILEAMGKVQNAKVRVGSGTGTVVLDVETIEDYAIWHVLLQWKWHGQFPSIRQLENELRYEFLPWYGNETNRSTLKKFKQRYPTWRQRLFAGDYVEFHQEVQDFIRESRVSQSRVRAGGSLQRRPIKKATGYGAELEAAIKENGIESPLDI